MTAYSSTATEASGTSRVRLRERERGRSASLDLQVGVLRRRSPPGRSRRRRAWTAARPPATRAERASGVSRSPLRVELLVHRDQAGRSRASSRRSSSLMAPVTSTRPPCRRSASARAFERSASSSASRGRPVRHGQGDQLVVRRELALEEPIPALGAPDDLEPKPLDHLTACVERAAGRLGLSRAGGRRRRTASRLPSAARAARTCARSPPARRARSRASPGRPAASRSAARPFSVSAMPAWSFRRLSHVERALQEAVGLPMPSGLEGHPAEVVEVGGGRTLESPRAR